MTTTNDDPQRPTPWTRPGFITSAIVIAFIIIAGVVIAIATHHTTPGTAGPTAATPTPTTPATTTAAGSDSVCGLPAGTGSILTTAPNGTEWKLVGSMAAPFDVAVGPGAASSGIHTCFAHSATGALYAAVNLIADLSAPDANTLAIVKARTAKGTGYDAAVALTQGNDPMPGGTGGSPIYQVAGFRYLDYTDNRATLEVIVRLTNGSAAGSVASVPVTMAWQDGDWKRVVQPDGTIPEGSNLDPSASYVHWSGA
jgi:hypothetical protein